MKSIFLTPILALAAATLLVACSIDEVQPTGKLTPGDGMGTVIVALTRSGDVNAGIFLELHRMGSSVPKQMLLDNWIVPRDWKDLRDPNRFNELPYATSEAPVGRLAVLKLPAGDYEFYKWKGDNIGGVGRGGLMYTVISADFSVPFSVKPGQVTYLGALQLELPQVIWPGRGRGSFQIEVTPKAERDLSKLKEKYPEAAVTQIATAQLGASNRATGLFYVYPLDPGDPGRD